MEHKIGHTVWRNQTHIYLYICIGRWVGGGNVDDSGGGWWWGVIHADGFCMTHIKVLHLFPRGILIFQGVLRKYHILMKFPHLEKNCRFNERLKI